jgi:hypothetical protein
MTIFSARPKSEKAEDWPPEFIDLVVAIVTLRGLG